MFSLWLSHIALHDYVNNARSARAVINLLMFFPDYSCFGDFTLLHPTGKSNGGKLSLFNKNQITSKFFLIQWFFKYAKLSSFISSGVQSSQLDVSKTYNLAHSYKACFEQIGQFTCKLLKSMLHPVLTMTLYQVDVFDTYYIIVSKAFIQPSLPQLQAEKQMSVLTLPFHVVGMLVIMSTECCQ